MVPLLLFSGKRGTDTRFYWRLCSRLECYQILVRARRKLKKKNVFLFLRYHQNSSPASSQTSFLCELKRFLGDVLPQDLRESSPLQLDSLKSLPPLTLGPSSSDTLLAGLINSSSITVFSFRSRASGFQVHSGELAFSPELLEELRRRLEAEVVKITAVMREEQVGRGATERLGRLRELSALPMMEPAPGDVEEKRGSRSTFFIPTRCPVRLILCYLIHVVIQVCSF